MGNTSVNKPASNKGWLANIWGDPKNTAYNIAALAVILLLLTGIFYTFIHPDSKKYPDSLSVKDMWNTINPMITGTLGYLFASTRTRNAPEKSDSIKGLE